MIVPRKVRDQNMNDPYQVNLYLVDLYQVDLIFKCNHPRNTLAHHHEKILLNFDRKIFEI